MDIQSVKNMLGITTSKHDAYLTEVIPLFIEHAKFECNNTFNDGLPAGVKLYVAKAIEHNMGPSNLRARSMDTVSYTYETDLPSSVKRLLAPYRRLRFR